MSSERHKPAPTPCLCNALREATRAVSRLYDEELRGVGLRTTQYSLLRRLSSAGEVRQRDLGGLTSLDETTLTRNLRPLIGAGWVAIRPGEDRREKLVRLTDAGAAKLQEARPAWERAQERLRLPKGTWSSLMDLLPELTRLADTT
jgi:DNA-binding MarR family transcriptional regulator